MLLNWDQTDQDDSEPEPDEGERILKLATIPKIVNFVPDAIDEAVPEDFIMSWSLRFRHDANLKSYEELHKNIKRRATQKTLNDFLQTVWNINENHNFEIKCVFSLILFCFYTSAIITYGY